MTSVYCRSTSHSVTNTFLVGSTFFKSRCSKTTNFKQQQNMLYSSLNYINLKKRVAELPQYKPQCWSWYHSIHSMHQQQHTHPLNQKTLTKQEHRKQVLINCHTTIFDDFFEGPWKSRNYMNTLKQPEKDSHLCLLLCIRCT